MIVKGPQLDHKGSSSQEKGRVTTAKGRQICLRFPRLEEWSNDLVRHVGRDREVSGDIARPNVPDFHVYDQNGVPPNPGPFCSWFLHAMLSLFRCNAGALF
jgi:hypothetical protein